MQTKQQSALSASFSSLSTSLYVAWGCLFSKDNPAPSPGIKDLLKTGKRDDIVSFLMANQIHSSKTDLNYVYTKNLLEAVIDCLIYRRDTAENAPVKDISIKDINDHMTLDKAVSLMYARDIPSEYTSRFYKGFSYLAFFIEEEALLSRINSNAYYRHNSHISQLQGILFELDDIESYIIPS